MYLVLSAFNSSPISLVAATKASHMLASCNYVQGDPGGKVNILKRNNIGNCEKYFNYEHWFDYEWVLFESTNTKPL